MTNRLITISHKINNVNIEQRLSDGFINGTAMCVAHGKNISDWLKNDEVFELVEALANELGIQPKNHKNGNSLYTRVSAVYPSLVVVKRGSPENGGGTWLHPDLAIQLAQWCSKPFAIQVSRWIQDWIKEWMASGKNPLTPPVTQGEFERLEYRTELKDESRLRMTNQVMRHLRAIQRYSNDKDRGIYFARVHDAINIAITGESAKKMRKRLSELLGREVKNYELIRDFYPAIPLQRFIALCEVVANLVRKGRDPLKAVQEAAELVLPEDYVPTPIEFTEHIKLIRQKVAVLAKRHSAS